MKKKRAPEPPREEIKVRITQVPPFGKRFPVTAQILLNAFLTQGRRRSFLSFSLNQLPPTVNHMYQHTRFGTRLTEEATSFRDMVALAVGHQRHTFKCGGTACVMIFLESPRWLTKKMTIREMDVDNRIKPVLDGIKNCTGVPDETNWEIHCWKVASRAERLTVYLFDLGDLVEFYS